MLKKYIGKKFKQFQDKIDYIWLIYFNHIMGTFVCVTMFSLIGCVCYILHNSNQEHAELCSNYCEKTGYNIYTTGGEFNNSNYCCCYDNSGIKKTGVDSRNQLIQILNSIKEETDEN